MKELLGQIITLKIDSIANGGNGIGRHNGIACFVPGTITGEVVKVKIVSAKKRYMVAEPIEIITPSEHRIPPECQYALSPDNFHSQGCPGCQYQHMTYKEELKNKTKQFGELLERFAGIKPADVLLPTVPSETSENYRNKITLHIDKSKNKLGYYQSSSRSIFDIKKCPIACGKINQRLKHFDLDCSLTENTKRIVFRYTSTDGVIVYSDKTSNDILLEENTSIGKFKVPLKSFFQINISARNQLVNKVINILQANMTQYAFDLYCGVGLFAVAAKKAGAHKVYASDIDKKAIHSAQTNAKLHNCKIKFLPLPAFSAAKSILSTLPSDKTTLILDPPRTGLDNDVINYIIEKYPKNIIYISCGPDTLCRDLKKFSDAGYNVQHTQIVDIFPRTAHFETITFLSN